MLLLFAQRPNCLRRAQVEKDASLGEVSCVPDFEDGLIRACAELNDVDVILTRDAAAFKRSKVRAMSCAEYLETFG